MSCEPTCGAATPCLVPVGADNATWLQWWAKHPSRAGIRPLSVEAAQRGGYDWRHTEVEHEGAP